MSQRAPTEREVEALRGLSLREMWPAEMGYHLAESSTKREFAGKVLNPQGAGRIGGTMLARLRAEGWAKRVHVRSGWTNANEITAAGIAILRAAFTHQPEENR